MRWQAFKNLFNISNSLYYFYKRKRKAFKIFFSFQFPDAIFPPLVGVQHKFADEAHKMATTVTGRVPLGKRQMMALAIIRQE